MDSDFALRLNDNGLPVEEQARRFYRRIEKRIENEDGTLDITLGCGHELVLIVPVPDVRTYLPCAECVQEWILADEAESVGRE